MLTVLTQLPVHKSMKPFSTFFVWLNLAYYWSIMHLERPVQCSVLSLFSCSLLSCNILLCYNHSLMIIYHTQRIYRFFILRIWRVFPGYIMCLMDWNIVCMNCLWYLHALDLFIKFFKVQECFIISQTFTWYHRNDIQEVSFSHAN